MALGTIWPSFFSSMRATTFRCRWLVFVMLITEAVLFPAPIRSQLTDEHAISIAPSLQEIYFAINTTKHDKRVTWESMSTSDFTCRPGYFVGLRYSDPPVDEMFVPSHRRSASGSKFSRVPPVFDSRQTWPDLVGESANQGMCGLCWAIAWAGVMSDRFAIGYQGNYSVGDLSPQDLQTCAQNSPSCATSPAQLEITRHILNVGIGKSSCFIFNGVLGRNCQLECHDGERPIRCKFVASARPCAQTCFRYRAASISQLGLTASDSFDRCWQIMQEIQKNGPVVASMNVYIDFLIYKTGLKRVQVSYKFCMLLVHEKLVPHYFAGVYSKTQERQRFLGKHSVKIIGWGSERGEPYWLIQNSWGALHGEAGLARIRRGTNECGIESEVFAPIPNFADLSDFEYSHKLVLYLESLRLNASNTSAANSTRSPDDVQSSAFNR